MINSQANNSYIAEIAAKYPYTLLSESQFNALFEDFKFVKFKPGQVLLRPDELPQRLLFVSLKSSSTGKTSFNQRSFYSSVEGFWSIAGMGFSIKG